MSLMHEDHGCRKRRGVWFVVVFPRISSFLLFIVAEVRKISNLFFFQQRTKILFLLVEVCQNGLLVMDEH